MADAEEISCAEIVELVTDYFEGVLPDETVARLDAHLADCEGCAAYLDQMRTAVELTGRLRAEELDPDVRAALVEAFRDW
jgi:predicted anti-sigma-YlaC factor YlaD